MRSAIKAVVAALALATAITVALSLAQQDETPPNGSWIADFTAKENVTAIADHIAVVRIRSDEGVVEDENGLHSVKYVGTVLKALKGDHVRSDAVILYVASSSSGIPAEPLDRLLLQRAYVLGFNDHASGSFARVIHVSDTGGGEEMSSSVKRAWEEALENPTPREKIYGS